MIFRRGVMCTMACKKIKKKNKILEERREMRNVYDVKRLKILLAHVEIKSY